MHKTDIEYLRCFDGSPGYCWNFWPGCLNYQQGHCPLPRCWARAMSRFRDKSFTPHLVPGKLLEPLKKHKPGRVGVCFTGDLFGGWVDPNMDLWSDFPWYTSPLPLKTLVFLVCNACPDDTFIFITKRPDRLHLWSPFPKNAWVLVSAWDTNSFANAQYHLRDIEATVRGISLEPLLFWEPCRPLQFPPHLNWLVLGQKQPVSAKTAPKIEWIKELVEAADRAGCAVFLKDNLWNFLIRQALMDDIFWASDKAKLKQEYPHV